MPTVFESITRAVVKEMDTSGEMIAVRSLGDADKFHCFYLVKKRRRFFGYQYDKTNLTLKDILESEVPFDMVVPEFQGQGDNFEILDVVDSKGSLTVRFHPQMTFKIAFHIFQEKNIKLEKSEIPQEFLDSLKNNTWKLKKELPPSFQSIQAKREDLYLVTETLKTKKSDTLKYETQFDFQSLLKMFGFQCEHKRQKEVTIPAEKVLAYRVKQLVFPSAERMGKSLSLENFQSIKERVQDMVRVLQDLTPEEQKEVLNCFTKCLSSDEELQDLEQRVSEIQCSGELQMNSPVNSLISSLFNAAGVLIEARAETIWDVLDALTELSEYRQFVAEALDKGTLLHMKDTVEPILKKNWGEGPLDVSCDPEAWTLYAFYVVVSILLQLAQASLLRQQEELDRKAAELERKERELQNTVAKLHARENNRPPLPVPCPVKPCFYQDFSTEIPADYHRICRMLSYLWMLHSVTLFLNLLACLTWFLVNTSRGVDFGLSILWFVIFTRCAFLCWYRPTYKAFRSDNSFSFFVFFFVFFCQIYIIQWIGIPSFGDSGWIAALSTMKQNLAVSVIMMVVGGFFTLCAVLSLFLLKRVHSLYRRTGAASSRPRRSFPRASSVAGPSAVLPHLLPKELSRGISPPDSALCPGLLSHLPSELHFPWVL
ncbi:hypothetical protein MJT46_014967 [Ovis ammon polii x Ovis aries]|nr:hypothetical protein MJT46_014967 [Ovis ammon polii x Ovis aries]